MKTRILITGASGFVGSKILESLVKEEGLTISALVRDPDKSKNLLKYGIDIYEGDITKPSTLKIPLSDKEIIIHCAALMSNFDAEPREKFYEVNVAGTRNLLEYCDSAVLRQLIHISTVGVYGATEEDEPLSEETPYGMDLSTYEWSKKEAELAVLKYAKSKATPFTILRPSQLYGPGMRYGWPETIKAIKSGRMFIPGSGRAKMHLLHINDFIKAIRLVMNNEKAKNKIYNIAGPDALSLGDIFDIIAHILGVRRPKKIPYGPIYLASRFLNLIPNRLKSDKLRLLTPHRVKFFATNHIYDISRARDELGYEPVFNVRDGFRDMIQWCEKEGLI